MIKLELNKEEVEAIRHMLKVEIESYKSDETETLEFNTLTQLSQKVSFVNGNLRQRAVPIEYRTFAVPIEWE